MRRCPPVFQPGMLSQSIAGPAGLTDAGPACGLHVPAYRRQRIARQQSAR